VGEVCNRGLTGGEEEEVESERGDKRLEVNRMRRWKCSTGKKKKSAMWPARWGETTPFRYYFAA
jgi:hypothetical protein